MLLGIVVVAVYAVVLIGLQKASGVPYPDIAKSADNLRKGVVIPVAITTVLLVVYAALTGRLLPSFSIPRVEVGWLWAVPVVFAAMIVMQFMRARWNRFDRRAIVFMVVGTALVGLSEELLVRGVFARFLQESGMDLRWIAVLSSVVFGLVHGLNIVNGQAVSTTVLQVVLTTVVGLGLFAAFAVSGTLWLPIALHFLMDLAVMSRGGTLNEDDETAPAAQVVLTVLLYLLSLASVIAY